MFESRITPTYDEAFARARAERAAAFRSLITFRIPSSLAARRTRLA